VPVLTWEGKCSRRRAKSAHFGRHLPGGSKNRENGMTRKRVFECQVQVSLPLVWRGRKIPANATKDGGLGVHAKTVGGFLLHLDHAQISLCKVTAKGHHKMGDPPWLEKPISREIVREERPLIKSLIPTVTPSWHKNCKYVYY
jgi:hypothetical protein